MQTENATPTWESLLPLMIDILRSSKDEKVINILKEEMTKMAKAADKYIKNTIK